MVNASPEAEAATRKSGLDVVDLLRPLTAAGSSFTVSTVSEPYRLKTFSFRFVHVSEFQEATSEVMEQHLSRLLSSYDCAKELDGTDKPPSATPPPWVHAFREQLGGALRNSEGASLDHPVGCLLVASATQPKPLAVFNALLASANTVPPCAEGLCDPAFPRTYVLLHDASDPSASTRTSQAALAEAAKAFGAASCFLITINTRNADAPLPEDIWSGARPAMSLRLTAPPAPGLSDTSPLSVEDVDEWRKLVEGPLAKQVLCSARRKPRLTSPHISSHLPPFSHLVAGAQLAAESGDHACCDRQGRACGHPEQATLMARWQDDGPLVGRGGGGGGGGGECGKGRVPPLPSRCH